MSLYQLLPSDDPCMAGNWWPFPPPDKGIYDVRMSATTQPEGGQHFFMYFGAKRVESRGSGRLLCMGKRVTRMTSELGWQFRFQRELQNCVPVRYRPFAVIYDTQLAEGPATAGVLTIVRKDDVSQQLPLAHSREEALYIVRQMPTRWPIFRQIHIEYTPELLQA